MIAADTFKRFPIAFQAFFPLIVMGASWYMPESPRWLQVKDRHAEAKQVLARLEGEPEDSEVVAARIQVIQNSINLEQQGHSNNPFARTPNRYLYRTLLAIVVNILAQMSGINVITFCKIWQSHLYRIRSSLNIATDAVQTPIRSSRITLATVLFCLVSSPAVSRHGNL